MPWTYPLQKRKITGPACHGLWSPWLTHMACWDGVGCVGGPAGGGAIEGAGWLVRFARRAGGALLYRVRREQLVIGGVPIESAAGPCTSNILWI